MATLDNLPDEVVLEVARFLGPGHVCALGAACRRMHAIAADPSLWRFLFIRDFARLYIPVDPRMVPPPDWLVPETWPPEACFLHTHDGTASLMPPPREPATGLPAPLAHAFAMGKDWQWMYRAHAVLHGNDPSTHGPGRKTVHGVMRVGDYDRGSLLYGAEVAVDGTYWEEAHTPWQADTQWRVECASGVVSCFIRDFCVRVWPASGRREWTSYSRRAIDSVDEWAGASRVTITTDAHGHTVNAHPKQRRRRARHAGRTTHSVLTVPPSQQIAKM